MQLYISGLVDIPQLKIQANITKILSIMEFEPPPYVGVGVDHTILIVNDDEIVGNFMAPSLHTISDILRFSYKCNNEDNVLIHCFAGVSRSTAAAMVFVYDKTRSMEACENMLYNYGKAAPNRKICSLADYWFHNSDPILFKLADKLCKEKKFIEATNNKLL